MPTFTPIALKNLLEPRPRDSCKKPLDTDKITCPLTNGGDDAKSRQPQGGNHIYISPALYITPDQAPIPEVPQEQLSPSPYIANRKRRGSGEVRKEGELEPDNDVVVENENREVLEEVFVVGEDGKEGSLCDGNEEEDGFLDGRCEVMSVGSVGGGGEVGRGECSLSFASAQGEFFDAIEDFSSDGSTSSASSHGPSLELELSATRLRVLDEIEKRKTAEEALNLIRRQWYSISTVLSDAGFSFPTPPNADGSMQLDDNLLEQVYQEAMVARFVAEAIGKGQARAEAESAAEEIIESKNQEISRLRDRLQYYEAVNHEMSQRNQEVLEAARRKRQRRNTHRRWFWSCLGLSVAIGASLFAYSYLPSKQQELPTSAESSDASAT